MESGLLEEEEEGEEDFCVWGGGGVNNVNKEGKHLLPRTSRLGTLEARETITMATRPVVARAAVANQQMAAGVMDNPQQTEPAAVSVALRVAFVRAPDSQSETCTRTFHTCMKS